MPYSFVPAKQFADAFCSFHMGQSIKNELSEPFDRSRSHPASLATSKFGVSWMALLKANIDRELLLMKRNSFVYIFNAVNRDLLFFPAWTYTIPSWILQIPVTFFEVGVYVFTTYYVVGFDPGVSRFFKQYLLLVALNQMSSSLFRFIAGLCRDMVVAQTIGTLSLLAFATLGGFILARRKLIKLLIVFLRERKADVNKWWIWDRMLFQQTNFEGTVGTKQSFHGQNDTTGISVLKSRGIFTEAKWYWIGFGALIGYTLLFNLLYTVALSYLKPLGDSYPSVPEDALEEKRANLTVVHVVFTLMFAFLFSFAIMKFNFQRR
uniref:ABC-2 type transporter domain-containing protein n=1 Tax=Leersia perrieri TaxID=77586 RepID=A0A0D9V0K2_9ORYZ